MSNAPCNTVTGDHVTLLVRIAPARPDPTRSKYLRWSYLFESLPLITRALRLRLRSRFAPLPRNPCRTHAELINPTQVRNSTTDRARGGENQR